VVEGLRHTDRPFSIMCIVPVKIISRSIQNYFL